MQESKNTEMLKESLATLNKTEEQAIGIQDELYEQRKKIEGIDANLKYGNEKMTKMDKTLKRMQKRETFLGYLFSGWGKHNDNE